MPVSLQVVSTEVVLVAVVDVVHVSSQAPVEVMSPLVHEVSARVVMLPVVGLLEDVVSAVVEASIEVGEAVTDAVSVVEVSAGSSIIPSG